MVFTLHRYIFRELFRVFVLATVALTLMLSLGSILRPVQEYGVGPGQVIHLIGYFLPIILTFVLPMAALFASSLIYGRFASDNELDACRASGVSMLTLVYPGLILAIIVAIANLILSFHVMPAFVKRAEKSLKADAKKILFRNIQRKGFYKMPDGKYLIYADQADELNSNLLGVIAVQLKNQGIEKIITAKYANIDFNPHDRFNDVKINAFETYQMGLANETGFSAEQMSMSAEFGSLMGDDIKFKKVEAMKAIRLDPIRFYPIEKRARRLYAQFTAELLKEDITEKLTSDSENFYELYNETNSIKFSAEECSVKDEKELALTGGVVLVESSPITKEAARTINCKKASLHIEGNELAPTLTMQLYNPTWQKIDGSEGMAGRIVIRGLIVPKSITDNFKTTNILEAISPEAINSALPVKSKELTAFENELNRKSKEQLPK